MSWVNVRSVFCTKLVLYNLDENVTGRHGGARVQPTPGSHFVPLTLTRLQLLQQQARVPRTVLGVDHQATGQNYQSLVQLAYIGAHKIFTKIWSHFLSSSMATFGALW